MGVTIPWALLALAVLVFWGFLQALVATLLPRFLARWEAAPESGPLRLEEPNSAPASARLEEPVLAPSLREVIEARRAVGPGDPMVAAAIALALTLYQQHEAKTMAPPLTPAFGSSWALAGRWQAMQARLTRPKR
jgi:hypothetical protein